ncbi:hypothetical protein IFM89_006184 [Coptis chinensis]|uniref:Lipid-binding serum glycoprotein C-terminal domain-containing protein n=1 Tax=Coptis chinensis TaxID=261450 RepID=A0A835GUR3_9MAGN|nr:hypothetical protein IFM89_006184 [Coptis chinensis]
MGSFSDLCGFRMRFKRKGEGRYVAYCGNGGIEAPVGWQENEVFSGVWVISASGSVEISRNMLVGSVGLDDFTLSLKWSNIGKFHMSLIQSVVWTFLKTVATPYVNSRLKKGFPLPIVRGFTLQGADIAYDNSLITICSDVVFKDSYSLLEQI